MIEQKKIINFFLSFFSIHRNHITTNKQKSSNEYMMALSTNTVDYPNRFSLPNTELFSIPDEEDEDDLNDTTEFENLEKEFGGKTETLLRLFLILLY